MSARFVSIDEMIGCAKREVAMRERCYPRWVQEGRMSEHKAELEIAYMQAIVRKLIEISGRRE
jgi:hypothetical protein